jgi:hypothetical protein
MKNPDIDFGALYGTPFAPATEGLAWEDSVCTPCPGQPPCPSFQEVRIEPEPDWQELVNRSWRNHPVLRNVTEGFYPETVRRQQVQGIVQIAQEFRKVRGLGPHEAVWILPPNGIRLEMAPIIDDLRAHGILVSGYLG